MREQTVLHPAQEHHRKFQALGSVQRHHLHAIFPSVGLPLTGLEHGVGKEGLQRRQFTFDSFRCEATRGADELVQVLDASFTAVCLVFLVVLDQAAALQHVIDLFV